MCVYTGLLRKLFLTVGHGHDRLKIIDLEETQLFQHLYSWEES